MCYYGIHIYKQHYTCFQCRKAFKYENEPTTEHQNAQGQTYYKLDDRVCPQCGGVLHTMGRDFKVPPRNNIKQWKKVEKLFQNGITFHSCGCTGPGYRPKSLNEVDAFLENVREEQIARAKRLVHQNSPRHNGK